MSYVFGGGRGGGKNRFFVVQGIPFWEGGCKNRFLMVRGDTYFFWHICYISSWSLIIKPVASCEILVHVITYVCLYQDISSNWRFKLLTKLNHWAWGWPLLEPQQKYPHTTQPRSHQIQNQEENIWQCHHTSLHHSCPKYICPITRNRTQWEFI